MKIEKIDFGKHDGHVIQQYILHNDNGIVVKIMNYGATITSIETPDKNGDTANIVCGFDNFEGYFSEEYKDNAPYFGNTPGRYAGRIKDGKFSIDGEDYTLVTNNGSNHLHGGIVGFDKKVWLAEEVDDSRGTSVKMSATSADTEEGYPGNLLVTVQFTLTNNNEIIIEYSGTTDKETPLTLTNHSYFNLSGFKNDIQQHEACIHATTILAPDETGVTIGKIETVENTPADLSSPKKLSEALRQMPTGFEHYFIFDKYDGNVNEVAKFSDAASGRSLVVSSNETGVLFYTGYYTSDNLQRENGDRFGRYRGFCVETSRYPNGPNIKNSPGSTTKPGEKYSSTTIFSLSW